MNAQPAVFLDRDGVINRYPGDRDYVKSWEEFHFLPQVKPALKRLNERGYALFIVSNQAGVSKGIYSQGALDLITKNMLKEFDAFNISICEVYYCIHRQEENCCCRKPRTGLVDVAVARLKKEGVELRLEQSYFIGDTIRDIETGRAAGLKTILVFSGKEKSGNKDNWGTLPDYTADDLLSAVDLILNAG
ncbi:MAG: HAD family hydrolase [Candidatus Omnitrophota bacterium]